MYSNNIFNPWKNNQNQSSKSWLFPTTLCLLFPWGKPILEADACTLQALAGHRGAAEFLHSAFAV